MGQFETVEIETENGNSQIIMHMHIRVKPVLSDHLPNYKDHIVPR